MITILKNNDIFCEYMVCRKPTARVLALKAVMILMFLVITACYIVLLVPFPSLKLLSLAPVWAILLVVTYYMVTSLNVEYEYTVTNGEMDVDKIIAKRRRNRLITFHLSEAEAFGRYLPQKHSRNRYQKTIVACDRNASTQLWFCVARVPDKGSTLVIFNATQKLLDSMTPFLRPGLGF